MSTFNGLISEVDGVSVDCFQKQNLNSRVFFLSHCHTDHFRGIDSTDFVSYLVTNGYFIYTSEISSIIITNKFTNLKTHVKDLSIGETHTISIPKLKNNEERFINVKLIPAGHCPGSVMFLFLTPNNKTILYTGDFRIKSEDLSSLRVFKTNSGPITIDKIYLDTTFWNKNFQYFPSRKESCEVLCDIIKDWLDQHSDNIINLIICANIGTEYLYMDIYNKLKLPINIMNYRLILEPSYRRIAELENVFTLDESAKIFISNRFSNNRRACNIKVSAMKWRKLKDNELFHSKDKDGSYSICYSSHCSYDELKGFLSFLKPRSIEPCVVNNEFSHKMLNDFCKDFLIEPAGDEINMKRKLGNEPIQRNKAKYIKSSFYSSDSE